MSAGCCQGANVQQATTVGDAASLKEVQADSELMHAVLLSCRYVSFVMAAHSDVVGWAPSDRFSDCSCLQVASGLMSLML